MTWNWIKHLAMSSFVHMPQQKRSSSFFFMQITPGTSCETAAAVTVTQHLIYTLCDFIQLRFNQGLETLLISRNEKKGFEISNWWKLVRWLHEHIRNMTLTLNTRFTFVIFDRFSAVVGIIAADNRSSVFMSAKEHADDLGSVHTLRVIRPISHSLWERQDARSSPCQPVRYRMGQQLGLVPVSVVACFSVSFWRNHWH